jgi:TRAP-type C4-dicarboxylate transport system substrate-binding protein
VQVIHAVASGDVDLGTTSTGVLDSVGLASFEALSAPMLIDSYRLADAMLESDVPEQMLAGLEGIGVTGLGVSFQSLPHPLSEHRPLLAPADWDGVAFGTHRSVAQERVIRALGASPIEVFGPTRDQAIDSGEIEAFDFGVYGYTSEFHIGMGRQVPYIAENVVLWPQFNVLFVNPSAFAGLTDEQRVWLQQASDEATTFSEGLATREERYVRNACAEGARFAFATPSQLAGLRSALAPVLRQIGQDPRALASIEQIEQLNETTSPGAAVAVPAGCAWR